MAILNPSRRWGGGYEERYAEAVALAVVPGLLFQGGDMRTNTLPGAVRSGGSERCDAEAACARLLPCLRTEQRFDAASARRPASQQSGRASRFPIC